MSTMKLPIDPLARVLNRVMWRLTAEELTVLEGLATTDPLSRIMTLMNVVTKTAQREQEVRQILAAPGVLVGLKAMVMERKPDVEMEPTAAAETAQP